MGNCFLKWQEPETGRKTGGSFTIDTKISDVISDPVFEDYGRLIFPADSGCYYGNTLGGLQLSWYNNIDSEKKEEPGIATEFHSYKGLGHGFGRANKIRGLGK